MEKKQAQQVPGVQAGSPNERIIFYGTSGAEAVPDPFCACTSCQKARINGGKDRRRRSMLRVGEETLLDFGPDLASAAMDWGGVEAVRHVLVTHTHEDHFCTANLQPLCLTPGRDNDPVHFWLTDKAFDMVELMRKAPFVAHGRLAQYEARGVVAFHRLEFGRWQQAGALEVLPCRASHTGNMGEVCANYLLRLPGGQTLYYGTDTGYWPEETFELLLNEYIHILISECTFGGIQGRGERPPGHLDFDTAMNVFRRLLGQGTITADTRVYLTHLNHRNGFLHGDMEALCEQADLPCKIEMAWDGLGIE